MFWGLFSKLLARVLVSGLCGLSHVNRLVYHNVTHVVDWFGFHSLWRMAIVQHVWSAWQNPSMAAMRCGITFKHVLPDPLCSLSKG